MGYFGDLRNGLPAASIIAGAKRGLRPVIGGGDVQSDDNESGVNVYRNPDTLVYTDMGPAVITDAGPEGEEDYTDARYWVKWQQPDESDDPEGAVKLTDNPGMWDAEIQTATNMCEVRPTDPNAPESAEGVGTHLLDVGEQVHIFMTQDAGGTDILVFFRPIDSIEINLTGNLSGNGTYSADRWRRPTTDYDGTTDPTNSTLGSADPNAVVIAVNASEIGITPAGHKIDVGSDPTLYTAYLERVNADGSIVVSFNSDGSCTGTSSTTLSGSGSTASTSSWTLSPTSSNVIVTFASRPPYWDGTANALYGFVRDAHFECGMVVSISAETRNTIDSAEDCATP